MPPEPNVESPSHRNATIVAVTFVNLILFYGAWYSFSVFFVALLKEFGWSRSLVSGVFSTFLAVHSALAPLVGWLLSRFGPRKLILCGTIVMGFGLTLAAQTTEWWHLYVAFGGVAAIGVTLAGWMPTVDLIRGWFPNRVGTAIGIASSGIGVGIFVVVPLAQLLIDTFGWRWAYRVIAIAVVAWVLPATFGLIRDPAGGASPSLRIAPTAGGGRAAAYWTLTSATRTWRFWAISAVYFTGNFVTQMLLIHQVAYLVDHGVPALTAAALGGVAGLVSIAGKIGWGALSDRTSRPLAYGLAFGCVAASIGVLVVAGRYPASYLPHLYVVLIGIGYGAMAPLPPAVASDLFAGPGFSMIFGCIYTAGGFGLAAGTWSAGWIFDVTGSYAAALWLGAFMTALSPLLMWVVARPQRRAQAVPRVPRGGVDR